MINWLWYLFDYNSNNKDVCLIQSNRQEDVTRSSITSSSEGVVWDALVVRWIVTGVLWDQECGGCG